MENQSRPRVIVESGSGSPDGKLPQKRTAQTKNSGHGAAAAPQSVQTSGSGSRDGKTPPDRKSATQTKKSGKRLRATRQKLVDTWPVMMVQAALLMVLFSLLGAWVLLLDEESDFWYTFAEYFLFSGVWIGFLLFLRLSRKNRPILRVLWTEPKGNSLKLFGFGLLLGFGMNAVCVLLAWLHGDIHMFWHGANPLGLPVIFFAVFVQSSAEELVCRGFLYQRLRRSYQKPWVAIVCSSALFAVLHLFNNGINVPAMIDIFVIGVLFALMVYYLDSIWCTMAVHTAWNFTQNIIFGLPNSGMGAPFSILKLDAATATGSIFYDADFGIEASLTAILFHLIACVGIVLWARKHRAGKHPINPWLAQPNGSSASEIRSAKEQ